MLAVGGREGDRRAAGMKYFVDPLHPQPGLRPHTGVLGQLGRRCRGFLKIEHDDGGFGYHANRVDQRRDHCLRIELEVTGIVLIACLQVQEFALERQAFFIKHRPHTPM